MSPHGHRHTHRGILAVVVAGCLLMPSHRAAAGTVPAWHEGRTLCSLVLPPDDQPAAGLVRSTINSHLQRWYGVELPVVRDVAPEGTYIVAGTPGNNPALARLTARGLRLTAEDLGEEGFQILTHEAEDSRYIIIYGQTPRALKHGCQELVFYRLPATVHGGQFEWPLDVIKKPELGYRGIYMLPCWAAHDSLESWERVLRFNSELTINRNWFWLDGFPVAGHSGEYAGTDLADEGNVQRLLDLAVAEDMKILIGGGWFNWHHEKAVGKDIEKGIAYYLDYLDAFSNFHGFYIEPVGEGRETTGWEQEMEALQRLIALVLERRPEFEFALAIGKFNNPE
jgi:hypothetical protein